MITLIMLFFMLGFSVSLKAQTGTETDFPKMNFTGIQKLDTLEHFKISAHFKPGPLPRDFEYSQKSSGDSLQSHAADFMFYPRNFPKYELRMPIANGNFKLNMPTAVPDSSVHYYLKIKRFPFVNPLEEK